MKNIATEFGFEETALRDNLEGARGMHDNALDRTIHKQLVDFAKVVVAMKERYDNIKSEPALSLLNEHDTTLLVRRLQHNAELAAMDSEALHRKGGKADLFPLDIFAAQLRDFWDTRRDVRFGCKFKRKGEGRVPDNEASSFLWACVQWLDAEKYQATHVEASMKRINKGARKGGRQEPPGPVKADPSRDEYQKSLNKFLYGSQKRK